MNGENDDRNDAGRGHAGGMGGDTVGKDSANAAAKVDGPVDGPSGASGRTPGKTRLRTVITAACCAVVVVVSGVIGWNMGGDSVDVRSNAAYQAKAKELKRAETALTESKQDIGNRAKQVDEANDAIAETTKEMEHYQDLAKEFGPIAGDANPKIGVQAIGAAENSYGYHNIPITIHNNSSTTLTYYQINYQFTDDVGNITHTYFANSTAPCAANADCTVNGFDRFDPTGMTLTPISWTIDGTGTGTYGRYGTDVATRRF